MNLSEAQCKTMYESGSVVEQDGQFCLQNNVVGYIGDPLPLNTFYNNHYWPTYYPTVVFEKSKVDTAFSILDVLMKEGVINVTKVKQFVDLTNKIAKEL